MGDRYYSKRSRDPSDDGDRPIKREQHESRGSQSSKVVEGEWAGERPDCSQPRPSSSLAVHLGEHLVCVQLPFVVAQHPTDTAWHDMQRNPLLSVSRSPADFLESMDPSVRIKLRSMFDDGLVGIDTRTQ